MKELEMNPYVIQIDKLVNSIEKLSDAFLHLDLRDNVMTEEEYHNMCDDVKERVCKNCYHTETCFGCERIRTYELIREILCTVEESGMMLNAELKQKIHATCLQATQFTKAVLDIYKNQKHSLMWQHRIAQNREGCAVQLDSFAKMILHSTKELNASIFMDEHLEKKIKTRLSKTGVKLLSSVFFVTENGYYEIHVTIKSQKGGCITTKEIARLLSECTGREMFPSKEERTVVGNDYETIIYVENSRYQILQGVARIGKGCDKISGDNFSILELPGGKSGVILSDGMGAGEHAFKESAMVVEVLEELLKAGFSKETALQMLNLAMVMGREELFFSTIDMCLFDLYTGICEFAKAGAATTFIKRAGKVEKIQSTSLPLGVVSKLDVDYARSILQDGDMVIMVTDGVMDALPVGEQEILMQMVIEGTVISNPKEMAHHILEQILECSGEVPADDMTVLVIGIWSLEK